MESIYFVTNRRPNNLTNPTNFTGKFSKHGLSDLRFGTVGLSKKKLKIKLAPEKLVKDKERGRLDSKKTKLGSLGVMRELREKMSKEHKDVVVFIHGYNVSFREAVASAVKLQVELNKSGEYKVVLFSWPSNGSMMPFLAYSSDRQDAAASGPAFARGFMKLADFLIASAAHDECHHSIHLVAHSMGNYVLRHALQAIRREHATRLPRLFNQILLMAADEDDDAFDSEYKLRLLPNIARRVNVYFNRGDLALQISDKTKGNPDRLGTDGPRTPGQLPSRVSQVDCSDVVSGTVEHSYYLEEATVLRDMGQVLSGISSDRINYRSFLPENNQYRLRKQ